MKRLIDTLVRMPVALAMIILYGLLSGLESLTIGWHMFSTGHQPIFEPDEDTGEGRWACPECKKYLGV